MRILLAEDDAALGFVICRDLKKQGHTIDWLRNGQQVMQTLLDETGYEALILDLGLPQLHGHQILSTIRELKSKLSVIVISGFDEVENRIQTLALGADDYLTKPFDTRELIARIQAIVRRKSGDATLLLSNGRIELDPSTHRASYETKTAQLTSREFDLLHAMLLRPGHIFSRNQLEEKIYGWGQEVESNAIEFLIHSIRSKLGKPVIQNIRGVGWYIDRDDE